MKQHKKFSGVSLYVILGIHIIITAKQGWDFLFVWVFFQFSRQLLRYCRKSIYRLNFSLEHKQLICSHSRQFCSSQFKCYQLQLLPAHTFNTQTVPRDCSGESCHHHSWCWGVVCPGDYNSHLGISILRNSLNQTTKVSWERSSSGESFWFL